MRRLLTTLPHEFAALTPSRLTWWRDHADVVNRRDFGKLVVVTDAPGVRDYVEDRITGIVVARGEGRALAEAVRWAVVPRERR
jgi:glycosyltransferase involved in cell wall biosynthesis